MSKNVDMLSGSVFKNMVRFAVPLMLSGVLQLLFNAADLVVVGRLCSPKCVGAVGATGVLINLLVNFFIGFSLGTNVIIAKAIGAKNGKDVFEAVHTSMMIAFFFGAILTVVGVAFSETFLKWMGTPDDLIGLSGIYMRIYFCGITATMVYNFGASILRASGDTKRPLYFLLVSGVLNVVLNFVLVLFFDMDVDGVALATVASQVTSATLVLISLMKRDDECRFEFRKMKMYRDKLVKIIKIGLPAGLQSALFAISNVLIQSSVNSFGSTVVSGDSAASSIENFVWQILGGGEGAVVNFVGQNIGAKQYGRVSRIVKTGLLMSLVLGLSLGAIALIFGKNLLSVYLGDAQEEIAVGYLEMQCILVGYCLCSFMNDFVCAMRGLGNSAVPMIISLLGVCGFRILWIYTVFAAYREIWVLYISYPVSWLITTSADIIAYRIIKRRVFSSAEREVLP